MKVMQQDSLGGGGRQEEVDASGKRSRNSSIEMDRLDFDRYDSMLSSPFYESSHIGGASGVLDSRSHIG